MRGWDRIIDIVIMSALGLVMGGLRLAHFVALGLEGALRPSEAQDRVMSLR